MHDEHIATRLHDGADEVAHESVVLALVEADPVLDGHRDRNRGAHRPDTVRDQLRFRHQAGAEGSPCDPLGRTTTVQIDLGVTPSLSESRAMAKIGGVAAA